MYSDNVIREFRGRKSKRNRNGNRKREWDSRRLSLPHKRSTTAHDLIYRSISLLRRLEK
jgi:hypothetical protein